MPRKLSCAVIVPHLNEANYLPTFLASVDRQTRLPDRLLLVDDGSSDASVEICREFAIERPWVTHLLRPPRPPMKDRLTGSPELAAFLWGAENLGEEVDVIVKMDADLRLSPHHVATVLDAMELDASLGIAGTFLHVRDEDGTVRVESHPRSHVRGPTRFYRAQCLREISPIPQIGGWDGADEVRARARGWTTRTVDLPPDSPTWHLRPTGAHDGRLRAYRRWGECAYQIGYHPLAVLAAASMRANDRPRVVCSLHYLAGWLTAPAKRLPRAPRDIRVSVRREQMSRIRSLRRSLA